MGSAEEDKPRGNAVIGWTDFRLRAAEKRNLTWPLKPFVPPSGYVVVAGDPKSGKTLWVAWLTAQLLRAGKRVLFIELEGDESNLEQRVALFLGADISGLGICFRPHGLALDQDHVTKAMDTGFAVMMDIISQHRPDVIIIDPLVRAMLGDENPADAMRKVVKCLDDIGQAAHCPIVLVHHTRKADKEGRDKATAADVRGSGVLVSSAAVVAMVNPIKQDDPSITRFDVTCDDSWYERFFPQRCVVDFKARSAQEAMQMLSEDEVEHQSHKRSQELQTRIEVKLKAAWPGQMNATELGVAVKRRPADVRKEAEVMAREGLITVLRGGPGRPSWYKWVKGDGDGPWDAVTTSEPPSPSVVGVQMGLDAVAEVRPASPGRTGTHSDEVEVSPPGREPRPARPTHHVVVGSADRVEVVESAEARPRPGWPTDDEEKPTVIIPQEPAVGAACLTHVDGRQCGKPRVHGVWCEAHWAAVRAGRVAVEPPEPAQPLEHGNGEQSVIDSAAVAALVQSVMPMKTVEIVQVEHLSDVGTPGPLSAPRASPADPWDED